MVGVRSAAERATDEPASQDDIDPRWPLESISPTDVPLWKRMLDIAIVILAGPVLVPLLLAVALCVKLGSKGPVLFRQVRVGHLGQHFVIFKFRTMTAGTDASVHERHVADLINLNQPMTKLDARDPRLVPFGRVLRAAGLDELPQLLNVLKGEMSIVGPRPCVECEFDRYLPWQRERFNTLPGMTGLWQVSGKNRLTFTEMVDCDIRYARAKSLWLDLKIILMTPPAVLNEIRIARASQRRAQIATLMTSGEICDMPRAKVVNKPSVQ